MTVAFTIGTLVTDWSQYAEMKTSFIEKGFGEDNCEYLVIDNSEGNTYDAYAGLNKILNEARGTYCILCHQDVVLVDDGRSELEARLRELSERDPAWAVCGNAGGAAASDVVMRITDRMRDNHRHYAPYPQRVMSVDENFIVVRPDARIGFSHDLRGFHFYGADICLMADIAGYSAYVIDFHLQHWGRALTGQSFDDMRAAFSAKWSHAFRDRMMQTTVTLVRLSGRHNPRWLVRAKEWIAKLAGKARRSYRKRHGPAA